MRLQIGFGLIVGPESSPLNSRYARNVGYDFYGRYVKLKSRGTREQHFIQLPDENIFFSV